MKRTLIGLGALAMLGLSGCVAVPLPAALSTPQYVPSEMRVLTAPTPEEIHTSEEGIVRIEAKREPTIRQQPDSVQAELDGAIPPQAPLTPDTVWEVDRVVTYNSYTLPEKAVLEEDCLGVLTIPAIGLEMKVYEAEDEMEAMLKGGAHYKDTSAWDGNVGISAHNSGVPEAVSFGRLHELKPGDGIIYKTSLGERQYKVETILEISDEDWSWLGRTADNRLTLTTCVTGKPDKRFLVQAVQG